MKLSVPIINFAIHVDVQVAGTGADEPFDGFHSFLLFIWILHYLFGQYFYTFLLPLSAFLCLSFRLIIFFFFVCFISRIFFTLHFHFTLLLYKDILLFLFLPEVLGFSFATAGLDHEFFFSWVYIYIYM